MLDFEISIIEIIKRALIKKLILSIDEIINIAYKYT